MARLRVSIVFESGARIGPGKAKLLESIRDTGSISAAAREMGMSYKRAWLLLDSMNQAFTELVVTAASGGAGGGGATLTPFGPKSSNAIAAFTIGPQLRQPMIWRRSRGGPGRRLARKSETLRNCSRPCAEMRYSHNAIAHRRAMITEDTLTLTGLFLLAAALYSSVG